MRKMIKNAEAKKGQYQVSVGPYNGEESTKFQISIAGPGIYLDALGNSDARFRRTRLCVDLHPAMARVLLKALRGSLAT